MVNRILVLLSLFVLSAHALSYDLDFRFVCIDGENAKDYSSFFNADGDPVFTKDLIRVVNDNLNNGKCRFGFDSTFTAGEGKVVANGRVMGDEKLRYSLSTEVISVLNREFVIAKNVELHFFAGRTGEVKHDFQFSAQSTINLDAGDWTVVSGDVRRGRQLTKTNIDRLILLLVRPRISN